MSTPAASRPFMPGDGVQPASEGTGLLPWTWAEEHLTRSHEYWVATVRPDGRPHLMPVWGVWHEGAFWFSSTEGSRKTRDLRSNPHCSVSTDNGSEPVVLEGAAKEIKDPAVLARIVELELEKYSTSYVADSPCFKVSPEHAFGLSAADFTGSPTRWTF